MTEPADMMRAVAASMRERTGRTLEDWVALVREEGPDPLDQKAVRSWLRDVHGVPQNSQWAIATTCAQEAGWVMPEVDERVDALYSGAKGPLRPLHEAVTTLALALGPDVTAQPRASYIPFVRRTQFLAIAPGPRGTLRVGLRFRTDPPDDERLSPAKGFAQATHWLHLPADCTEQDVLALEPLLAAAYDANG